jgi:hypothetical protein
MKKPAKTAARKDVVMGMLKVLDQHKHVTKDICRSCRLCGYCGVVPPVKP